MKLGHDDIIAEYHSGKIIIEPYEFDNIGPNSVDVRLAKELLRVWPNDCRDGVHFINPLKPQKYTPHVLDDSGMLIMPGELWIGSTIEKCGSDYYIPGYAGRSTIGRMGLFTDICAAFGDVGFKQTWTLELCCVTPFLLVPGMQIGQVFFDHVTSNNWRYDREHKAHYANQNGPTAAKT